jgi:threonine dehydratase
LPQVECILAPVGGGGMLSGISTAAKLSRPEVKIIGVEPELAGDAQASFRARKIVQLPASDVSRTLADGLRTQSVGPINFEHIRKYVDDIVTVTEADIRETLKLFAAKVRTTAEPSGVVAAAAYLFHRDRLPTSKVTVAVVSGGNIEPQLLQEIRQGEPSE